MSTSWRPPVRVAERASAVGVRRRSHDAGRPGGTAEDPIKPLPGVDEDLMRVLLDGLAFSPGDRPTAAQFRDRLAALDIAQSEQHGSTGSQRSRQRVQRVVLALVSATVVSLLVVMLGGSGVYLYEIDRSVTANINREIDLPPEVHRRRETAGEGPGG